ncbi:MAG: aldehyde dehydrogenase family protein [Caldisphaera sp.]|jgi:succinyl-CoA reductase|nr:MAG: aldehyde dehydrogenase [Caldisphaera sp.]PMP89475.1 MAG: aldehyde dehydrogenase [Caldisphaera sp.]
MKGILLAGNEIDTGIYKEIRSPGNFNLLIDKVSFANKDTVKEAISCGVKGFERLSSMPLKDRAKIIYSASELIEKQKEDLSKLLSLESGKPIKDSRIEVMRSIYLFRASAEEARFVLEGKIHRVDAYDYPPGNENRLVLEKKEPIGIIAAILPFNFPANSFAHKVAPNIMAGNSVIVKPSPYTPLTAIEMGKILYKAGLPKEALSVLPGNSEVGDQLINNDNISGITFTGSTTTGITIAAKAIRKAKKLMLEMGGSDPIIVLDDADIDNAINISVRARFEYAGQNCNAGKRIIVHERIYEKFVNSFVKKTILLKTDDPLNESTDLGPIISNDALNKMEQFVLDAINKGGKLETGGKRINLPGYYFEPTVISKASIDSFIMKEEVFGPIAPIISFSNDEEAINIANSTNYGLQAAIFSKDIKRSLKIAEKLRVGGVMINDSPRLRWDSLPFGGVKLSGIGGREGIRSTIETMTETKIISINLL